MLPIPNFPNYFVAESEPLPRIWSARRAGCRGIYLPVIINCNFRCCNIINTKKKVELKIIAHLVWSAHNPNKDINHKIIGFTDGNQANDRYENLYAKERYLRDKAGNIIVSFS